MSAELPQGWATAPVATLAEAHMGETILAKQLTPTGVPVYSAGQENEPWGFLKNPRKPLANGTVVVSARGSIGFPKIPKVERFASTQTTITLHFPDEELAAYSCLWLKTVDWSLLTKGGAIPMLTVGDINELVVPLAPLAEQRRVVAKLDKLLGKVDACQQRLAKIPMLLKRFRQSVLAAACSSHLTADWREENPDAEPYAVESEVETGGEFPPNWKVTRLGPLTTLVTSGSRGWAKYYADSGSIFIRAQNINSDFLNLDDIAFVRPPVSAEGLRTKVRQRDILITITGANVTKSALVEELLEDAYVSQHVALVRLRDARLAKFLFYFVVSPTDGRKQLQAAAYGQGKPGLNLDNIRDVLVDLPPLIEQQEIVRRVETVFALADQIEARYAKAKAYVEKLTQSILAQAFRGELVPQDPTDEPASMLLERIKRTHKPSNTR